MSNFGDPFGEAQTAVTAMREPGDFKGFEAVELRDGNMGPMQCSVVGKEACRFACQLGPVEREAAGIMCAENNLERTLAQANISPESFVRVVATKDNVLFGDQLADTGATLRGAGYTELRECNAFFFRAGLDKSVAGAPITATGMGLADCGSVNYQFTDREGNLVLGQAHFSRTNMRGETGFIHELEGAPVSWAEYVLGSAVAHYGTDPKDVKIKVTAAVEGKDFIHHYPDKEAMERHYPSWEAQGFMHPAGEADFDCLIDYREMIEWQLDQCQKLGLPKGNIDMTEVVNTGDITLGYSSHHWASKGAVAPGRDLYILSISPEQA